GAAGCGAGAWSRRHALRNNPAPRGISGGEMTMRATLAGASVRRIAIAAVVALVGAMLATILRVSGAGATTSYSDYVVFGEHGVMVGAGSTIIGLTGARHDFGAAAQCGQQALCLNGGASIVGDARVGQDVNLQ